MFKPRLLNLPEPIGEDQLFKDLSAGLIVGIIISGLGKHFVYKINGPIFFSAADKIIDAVVREGERRENVILLLRIVPAIDATAYQALLTLRVQRQRKTRLSLAELRPQPAKLLDKYSLFKAAAKVGGAAIALGRSRKAG